MSETISNRCSRAAELTGLVALVVGCGETGLNLAMALARAGARTVLTDPSPDLLTKSEAAMKAAGLEADTVAFRLAGRDPAFDLAGQVIRDHGKIDILVNALENFVEKPATEITSAEWQQSVNLHLKTVFWMCQAAGKHMLQRGSGSIINLSSVAGSLGFSNSLAFATCKGGVDQMTRTLGVEWMRRGVRVNAIAPWSDGLRKNPEPLWLERTPLGRLPDPAELAGTVVFLASPASSVVSGQVLNADGGYSAQ